MTLYTCRVCGQEKPQTTEYFSPTYNGFRLVCRLCRNAESQRYRSPGWTPKPRVKRPKPRQVGPEYLVTPEFLGVDDRGIPVYQYDPVTDPNVAALDAITIPPAEDNHSLTVDTPQLLFVLPDQSYSVLRLSCPLSSVQRKQAERVLRPGGRIVDISSRAEMTTQK